MAENFDAKATVEQLLETSKQVLNEKNGDHSAEGRLMAEVRAVPQDEINQVRQMLAANDDKHLFNVLPGVHLDFDGNNQLRSVTIKGADLTTDIYGNASLWVNRDGSIDESKYGARLFNILQLPDYGETFQLDFHPHPNGDKNPD
jgi:hypothetical protein